MVRVNVVTILLNLQLACAFLRTNRLAPFQTRRSTDLAVSRGDEEGFTVKKLGLLVIGVFGVFGTGFLTSFKNMAGVVGETASSSAPRIKTDAGEKNRGSMTRLTMREINNKLAQIPVFYVLKDNAVLIDGEKKGYFFMDKADAEEFSAKTGGEKVGATSLDDVFFTLIQKKTKLGSYIEGVAATANPAADYFLKPSAKQVSNTPSSWRERHGETDVPLFRVTSLAFAKENGLEFPLFVQKEDALNAFERLQAESPSKTEVELQVTSLLDLVQLFSTGGFEGRALEVYPSMDAIASAKELMER